MATANWYKRIVVPRLLTSVMKAKKLDSTRQAAVSRATGTVLELGVGPGYNFKFYKNIEKLYALEPSAELVAEAKTRVSGLAFPIEFLNVPAEQIPLPDQSVDTVTSTWTLCSVSDSMKVLGEVKRILRPGGRFIFVEHGASPNRGLRALQTACTALTKYFTGNCHYSRQIDELITEAGFTLQESTHPAEGGMASLLIYNYEGVAAPGRPTNS